MPLSLETYKTEWFPYALFLSLCFIIFFNVNAYTTQKVGMIITSIFQKLSLVFPVIMGISLFGEAGSMAKYMAIVLAILSIIFITINDKSDEDLMQKIKQFWYWPFLVLIGSGIIELTLFYTQETGKVTNTGLDFVSILFFMAGCWGTLFLIIKRSFNFKKQDLIGGVLLGIPNFFTIYLLIKGLEDGWDGSILFPVNNLGVIVFTTIFGLFVFKERLSKINIIGLLLAVISVYLISK